MAIPFEEAADIPPVPFEAPGPGTWELDVDHFAVATPPLIGEVFQAAFPAGMAVACERTGLMLETIACEVVNGFPYMQPRVPGAPAGGKPPPAWAMRLVLPVLIRLNPVLRSRLKTARTLFERRPWRDAVRDWDARLRQETIDRHARVALEDLGGLDDEALALHVLRVREHAIEVLTQDHSLNGDMGLPLGDFLVRVGAWTGRTPAELMHVLRGGSAISSGDSIERRRLVAAITASPEARAVLEGSGADPRGALAALRAMPGPVGEATRDWLLITGNVIAVGIDIRHPSVREDPGAALAALRIIVARGGAPEAGPDPALRAALRAQVPEAHQAEFDVLVDDALAVARLRDERHLYGAMPVLGIARAAVVEAGRRLAARGALERAEDAMLCGSAELVTLLRGGRATADWPARRRMYATRAEDVPHVLGDALAPPPDPDWLPAPMARGLRALVAYQEAVNGGAAQAPPSEVLKGLAVSRGVVEGVARLCRVAEDLRRVEPGDVLVAPLTTPAINVVLPILGAIVTDRGGALSHAAIVSREYGIPGVVGLRDATARIPDGARVRVDGDRGTVEVLA